MGIFRPKYKEEDLVEDNEGRIIKVGSTRFGYCSGDLLPHRYYSGRMLYPGITGVSNVSERDLSFSKMTSEDIRNKYLFDENRDLVEKNLREYSAQRGFDAFGIGFRSKDLLVCERTNNNLSTSITLFSQKEGAVYLMPHRKIRVDSRVDLTWTKRATELLQTVDDWVEENCEPLPQSRGGDRYVFVVTNK